MAPGSRTERAGRTPSSDERFRVALISDRSGVARELHDEFNVVVIPFERADVDLISMSCEAVVVDALQTPRTAEVSRIALGGTRGVVVLGPPRDPSETMRYLDLGASDYVSSTAAHAELLARVRAVARTVRSQRTDEALVVGPVTISILRREVYRNGELVHLTPNEFAVLEVLARQPGVLITHRQLIERVWGPEMADSRHYLRLYIRQLREKIEDDPSSPVLIQTEWGAGYRLSLDSDDERQRAASA